jgi:hypothetical protein
MDSEEKRERLVSLGVEVENASLLYISNLLEFVTTITYYFWK